VSSEAERRQLTVMFCDLVDSTALAARLDPEDLREVIAVYHRAVAETVGQFDGFVAKYDTHPRSATTTLTGRCYAG
jgi:class 3 adenylate cyclase